MKYFYTYSYYIDCPSCDGVGEDSYRSDLFESRQDLVRDLEQHFNKLHFYYVYCMDNDGDIEKMCHVNESTGWHAVRSVSLEIEGVKYSYVLKDNKWTLTISDPTENVLYGQKS